MSKYKRYSNHKGRLSTNNHDEYVINGDEDDDDIVEIDSTQNTSEYIQVNNAHTSPLSNNTTYFNNDFQSQSVLSSTHLPPSKKDLNYVSLKDKIELDKTLSKYRSDINTILTSTMIKNRHEPSSIASKYLNDIEYTGTTYKRPIKVENDDDDEVQITKTSYCPRPNPTSNKENKPSSSFFGSLFTRSSKQHIEPSKTDDNPYQYLSQIRGGNLRTRLHNTDKPVINEKPNLRPASLPTKEPNFLSNLFFNRLVPFVSHLGLQLSKILPYLVIIIFTVIILQYVRMKVLTNNNAASSSSSKSSSKFVPLTDNIEIGNINRHNFCDDIKDTECWNTKILVRELIDFLRLKSGLIECSSLSTKSELESTKDKSVHLNKIKNYLFIERGLISNRLHDQIALDSIISAVTKNPSWGLRLLNSSYEDTTEPSKVTYLMSIVSSKSISCRFKELLHFLYVRVIMFGSLIMLCVLFYLIYKAYRNHQLAKDKVFYELVSKATSMVEKQFEMSLADQNVKPFIAIAHIYDTIMDPSRRQASKKLWTKVVKFIEDHESRIHLETQFIDGEETHVWKWIVAKQPELNVSSSNKQQLNRSDGIGLANSTMITPDLGGTTAQMTQDSSSSNQTNKSAPPSPQNNNNGWQGDAFNRSEKLSHSPTPCLKIRNMFDSAQMSSDPSLAVKIHNDILLKCCSVPGSEVKIQNSAILHIACDKKSKEGCVYVKCTTNETAGRVYQALSGVWYNGRLLNVKFLRSDRYLERFPDSANFIKPLQLI